MSEFPFGRPAGRLKDQPGGIIDPGRAALVRCDTMAHLDHAGGHYLLPRPRESLSAMIAEATVAGHRLRIASSYRSMEEQARKFAAAVLRYGSEAEARKWVAKPGGSAHHTGACVDLTFGGLVLPTGVSELSSAAQKSGAHLKCAAWIWLHANLGRFGWNEYAGEFWHVEQCSTPV